MCTLCSLDVVTDVTSAEGLLTDCVSVLEEYLTKVEYLNPLLLPPDHAPCWPVDEDSQGTDDLSLSSLDRVEMIHVSKVPASLQLDLTFSSASIRKSCRGCGPCWI